MIRVPKLPKIQGANENPSSFAGINFRDGGNCSFDLFRGDLFTWAYFTPFFPHSYVWNMMMFFSRSEIVRVSFVGNWSFSLTVILSGFFAYLLVSRCEDSVINSKMGTNLKVVATKSSRSK